MKHIFLLISFTMLPELALAHGDHGYTVLSNVQHVLSHLEHFWPLVVALVIVIAMFKRPLGHLLKKFWIKD